MFFELKFAFRFFRRRRRGLIRFTALAAVIGIAAGVASLIVAQAVARGFRSEMQDKILANSPQISVFRNDGGKIEDWRELKTKIQSVEDVRGVAGADNESVLLSGPFGANYAVLTAREAQAASAKSDEIEIAIGDELANTAGLNEGSSAEVIILKNGAPHLTPVFVSRTFKTGLFDHDSTLVTLSTEDLARILGDQEFRPGLLVVSTADIYKADETAARIRERLDENFRVIDWQEANRPLFAALSFERRAALVVISLIILVAALNITTMMALVVNDRRRDIAVLRTCGAKTRMLLTAFVFEGMLLGLIGLAAGLALGLLFCFAANYFTLISIPAEVYLLSYIPLLVSLADICAIAAAVLLICLAATAYPAFLASRIKPLENLRELG